MCNLRSVLFPFMLDVSSSHTLIFPQEDNASAVADCYTVSFCLLVFLFSFLSPPEAIGGLFDWLDFLKIAISFVC